MAYNGTVNLLTGIRTLLTTTNPDFSTLVGGRITSSILPQGSVLPALVYSLLSWTREPDFDDKFSTARATVSFDVYALTHIEAATIADALDEDLRAAQSMVTMAVEEVERISISDGSENFGDVFTWRITLDYALYLRDI